MATKFTTPLFRGSYVHLFKARQINGQGEPKFGLTIILPKNKPETKTFLAKLRAEFNAAMVESFGKALPEAALKKFPIKDGDTWTDNDGETKAEYAGCWFITANNTRQPGLLVQDGATRRAPESESEMYSGAWYHASVNVYAYDNEWGKGVSVSLSGVLKMKDGEPFGSSFSEDEFADVEAAAESTDEPPL